LLEKILMQSCLSCWWIWLSEQSRSTYSRSWFDSYWSHC